MKIPLSARPFVRRSTHIYVTRNPLGERTLNLTLRNFTRKSPSTLIAVKIGQTERPIHTRIKMNMYCTSRI